MNIIFPVREQKEKEGNITESGTQNLTREFFCPVFIYQVIAEF